MFVSSRKEDKKVELLQMKLKTVSKMKVSADRKIHKLSSVERSLCEELYSTKAEINFLTEQLEDLKDKISDAAYQISKTEVEKESQKSKIESYVLNINNHRNGFHVMFNEKRNNLELRKLEFRKREADKEETERKIQEELCRKKEKLIIEVEAIEEECSAIERECAVLKKRNAAIMLKLRKKLIETEDARRELMTRMHDNATQ